MKGIWQTKGQTTVLYYLSENTMTSQIFRLIHEFCICRGEGLRYSDQIETKTFKNIS